MPPGRPLSVNYDVHELAPVVGAEFSMAELHPDLWVQAALAELLPLVSRHAKTAAECTEIEEELRATFQGKSVSEDLHYGLAERDTTLDHYVAEIVDQAGSFHHCYYNVLSIQPALHPNTAKLISVGMMLGGIVGMEWKLQIKRARPVEPPQPIR